MSSLLGRAVRVFHPSASGGPGPLDSFVDSLVQKLENCRVGLSDETLARGPTAVEAWALALYEEEIPRLRDTIRLEESLLTREAREELFRKVDDLVRKVVVPGWVRLAAKFTPRERNGFFGLAEPLHGLERAGWALLGMALGFLVVWAPFIPIWSKEWVLPFTVGGLVFPELRRWFSFRKYEGELNQLVGKADSEISRVDLAYLTDTTSVAEREARDDEEARSRARRVAAESAAGREG
ncbi:MAG: hypothetical protein U0529_05890 [Thermoanaerobaculia bacterium]